MSQDLAQIKQRLLGNLESTLRHLLPAGQVKGHEYLVGSVHGEEGGSLKVHLEGAKAGLWKDFSNNDRGGDIVDLWCRTKGKSLAECLPEMARYVGFTRVERPIPKKKPPAPDTSAVGMMRGTKVYQYLQDRGISEDTMRLYRIRSHQRQSQWNTDFICFQFWDSTGDHVMIKSTGLEPRVEYSGTKIKRGKDIWSTAPYATLWGWWMVGPDCREIAICEGEMDACSLHQLGPGMPVLSLPTGASNLDWIDNDYDALQRFERIWICTDSDEPGQKCAQEIARRLGRARCHRIPMPEGFKDVNEALVKADPEVLEIAKWFDAAYQFDPPTLQSSSDFKEEARRALKFRKKADEENNFLWPSVPFQFRKGELTEFTGYPFGGKSTGMYQTHLHEMRKGEKVLMVSYEIPPYEMLAEMCLMLCGGFTNDEQVDEAMEWLDGKLWFYNPPEDAGFLDLMADCKYALQRFGVTMIAIDSLFFLVGKEDYEGQDRIVKTLKKEARHEDIHISLVCHSGVKKGGSWIPGMHDVEGSGGLTKPADNILTFWRNVDKAEAIEKVEESGDEAKIEAARNLHDGLFVICKQRLTGKTRRVKLWFNSESKTFRLKRDDEPPAPITLPPGENQEEMF